jgi:hypothetical protein
MLPIKELECPVSLMTTPPTEDHLDLFRLLAAAIVNPSFCQQLLIDPKQAIDNGYQGETFNLSDNERYLLLFIHADSLADLARQIAQAFGLGIKSQACSFAPVPVPIGY